MLNRVRTVVLQSLYLQDGAAFIWTRNGTSWSLQTVLLPADAVAGAMFGTGVALTGDGLTAVVGAAGTGRLHVFTYSTSWMETTWLDIGPFVSFVLAADSNYFFVSAPGPAIVVSPSRIMSVTCKLLFAGVR
jgi:hypothetical protein